MKKWRFDALLAEYTLPRLDGVRLLLLSRMMWPDVPVLLLSADLADLPLALQRQGASTRVSKPFYPQCLLDTLQEAILLANAEYPANHMTSEVS